MKILHTSDWHLGHRLHEQLQEYEQEKFLEWLLKFIKENKIDILLVSGDIFDTAYPSAQSMTMFYDFLGNLLRNTYCKHIVITAGNHDSPGTLEAPKELVRYFSINMIGKAGENIEEEILEFDVNGEKLLMAAVPYLRDRDIRKAVAGETFDEIETRYKRALTNHYNLAAESIRDKKNDKTVSMAMGHLFALGTETSESEQIIYVGGIGDISADDFPEIFDYIALGHLHRPQTVGGKEHIRYSGSPYPLSFSEAGHSKKVVVLKTQNGKLKNIDEIDVPSFRPLYRISGTLEECRIELEKINSGSYEPEPWVDIILDNRDSSTTGYADINTIVEGMSLKVLNVRLKNYKAQKGLDEITGAGSRPEELKPEEVFRKKCEEEGINQEDEREIFDAFMEILNHVNDPAN